MSYLVGILLALGLLAFFWAVGFLSPPDRGRVFWSVMLIIVAHYYILFSVMGGSRDAILAESIAATVFLIVAVAGFKTRMWLVALGLAAHGVFDFFHSSLIADPGVPAWWPAFCLSFDVVAAVVLFARLRLSSDAR